jgi:hypothetical protein
MQPYQSKEGIGLPHFLAMNPASFLGQLFGKM